MKKLSTIFFMLLILSTASYAQEGWKSLFNGKDFTGWKQLNGKAKRSVQQLQDLVRTYKSAKETRIERRIPTDHPVLHWMVEHAASTGT